MRNRFILFIALLLSYACFAASNAATDRVTAFLTNAYTGVQMQPDDWLTEEARTAELFLAFGGLDALVRQSTASAKRYGGLESVRILTAKEDGRAYLVTAEVHLKDDDSRRSVPAKAVSEDMVWRFRVVTQDGKLLLEF